MVSLPASPFELVEEPGRVGGDGGCRPLVLVAPKPGSHRRCRQKLVPVTSSIDFNVSVPTEGIAAHDAGGKLDVNRPRSHFGNWRGRKPNCPSKLSLPGPCR